MSKLEHSIALVRSGNFEIVAINNPPESLEIGDLPAPNLFGDYKLLIDAPVSIYPRQFDDAIEVGFLKGLLSPDRNFRRYGEDIALKIGNCALYPKIYEITQLDPDRSVFSSREVKKDFNRTFSFKQILRQYKQR